MCLAVQGESGEPPSKRVRTEDHAAADAGKGGPDEEGLPEDKDKEVGENGRADAAPVNRDPLSDLETLQELGSISGGCCICTLR